MAIRDAGYEPIEYAGTSGGSIIASLAACGMSLDEMHDLSMTQDWTSMLAWSPTALFSGAYCSGDNLLAWLMQKTKGRTFADLDIDLSVVASDISTEAGFVFNRKNTPDIPIALAVRASTAIPQVYKPASANGSIYQDGGMCDNMPLDCLKIDDIPRLGIQLVSKVERLSPGVHSMFEILSRDIDMILRACENAHVDLDKSRGGHFAFIETGYASALDRNMDQATRQRLFKDGYDGAMAVLKTMQAPVVA